MKLVDRFRHFLTKNVLGLGDPASWTARDWQAVLGGRVVLGGVSLADLLRNSTVVSCASLIADSLASVPLRVVQHMPTGGVKTVTEADACASLLTFNWDDRAASVFMCATAGNSFVRRDPSDGSMYALSSAAMTALDSTGAVWVRDFDGVPLAYSTLAHYRFRSAPRYALGFSPLVLAGDSMGAALAVVRMANSMAANMAQPGIVLEAPSALSDKAIANIKDGWREAVGGEKTGSIAVLEEGIKATILKIPNLVEADLVNAWEFAASEVARAFSIPPELVGLQRDSNRATASESARQFSQRCLNGWSHRTGDKLSRLLLSPAERAAGLVVEHDLQELSLGQGKERSEYLAQLVGAGIMKPNEGRNLVSLEDAEGGDVLRPPNTQPASQPASGMNGSHPKPNGAANGASAGA